jgi:RimJ/RimL family protein N-acetyltransferase
MEEILSYTALTNVRSQAVMARVGLKRDETRDFEVEDIPDPAMRRQIMFAAARATWTSH